MRREGCKGTAGGNATQAQYGGRGELHGEESIDMFDVGR